MLYTPKVGHTLGNMLRATWLHATCCVQQYHAELGNMLRAHHKVAIGNLVVFIMAEADVVGVCAAVIAIRLKNRRRKRRERSMWVKKWLLNRGAHGAYEHLLQELKVLDVSSYRNFVRMDAATFEELLGMVAPLIIRKDTKMRQSIRPGERLALTLRFLATGWQLSKLLHPRMLCDNQFMQYL